MPFTALAISGNAIVSAVLVLLIAGIILGLLLWLVGKSPVPDPFKSVLTWLLYLVGVLLLINLLLSIVGKPFISFT